MDIKQPLSTKNVIQIIFATLTIVCFIAGYYHATLINERKKYNRLEDMYVRVRGELGTKETQRLIDISREKDGMKNTTDW